MIPGIVASPVLGLRTNSFQEQERASTSTMEQGGVDSIHAFAAGRAGNEGACTCSTAVLSRRLRVDSAASQSDNGQAPRLLSCCSSMRRPMRSKGSQSSHGESVPPYARAAC